MEHYYVEKPTGELRVKSVALKLKSGRIFHFQTPSGVFSFGQIDKATRILIEHAVIGDGKLLDLGCGYGVIGIVLKAEHPDLEVFMSDINSRAVEFAKINSKNNNVDVVIKNGPFYEPWRDYKFDMILTNPPMAAGKKVVLRMIYESLDHLNDNGSLQVVAYHNKGGTYIKKAMFETFKNVDDICKEGGIRVYRSIKKKENAAGN